MTQVKRLLATALTAAACAAPQVQAGVLHPISEIASNVNGSASASNSLGETPSQFQTFGPTTTLAYADVTSNQAPNSNEAILSSAGAGSGVTGYLFASTHAIPYTIWPGSPVTLESSASWSARLSNTYDTPLNFVIHQSTNGWNYPAVGELSYSVKVNGIEQFPSFSSNSVDGPFDLFANLSLGLLKPGEGVDLSINIGTSLHFNAAGQPEDDYSPYLHLSELTYEMSSPVVTSVPEPGTTAMMLLGLASLAWVGRRKAASSTANR